MQNRPSGATGGILAAVGKAKQKLPLILTQEGSGMKNVLMLLALLLTLGAAVRADCPPAQCPYGSHSVCVEQCDPNKPLCEKVCKCRCEKDKAPELRK
jgi:hypothetical protein